MGYVGVRRFGLRTDNAEFGGRWMRRGSAAVADDGVAAVQYPGGPVRRTHPDWVCEIAVCYRKFNVMCVL